MKKHITPTATPPKATPYTCDYSGVLGSINQSVVYDSDAPLQSTYVGYDLVGFCNKALEQYNNHTCCYQYVRLLKAEKTRYSYISDFEIIFDASLSDEDGYRVETFEASIKTGLKVQKGFQGYAEVVEKVVKRFNPRSCGPWAAGGGGFV